MSSSSSSAMVALSRRSLLRRTPSMVSKTKTLLSKQNSSSRTSSASSSGRTDAHYIAQFTSVSGLSGSHFCGQENLTTRTDRCLLQNTFLHDGIHRQHKSLHSLFLPRRDFSTSSLQEPMAAVAAADSSFEIDDRDELFTKEDERVEEQIRRKLSDVRKYCPEMKD